MIARQIRVRYREPGYLRLQLPERFRRPEIAPLLKERLSKVEGIYRVDYWRSGKLVIRYHTFLLPEREVARQVLAALENLPAPPASSGRLFRWRERWQELRESVRAVTTLLRQGTRRGKGLIEDPERFLLDFANDLLMLYLLKVHWRRITQEWLVSPWRHRYEWLATFYLTFLLVRYRSRS